MQRKGLYYELVTAQSDKEREKRTDKDEEEERAEILTRKNEESLKDRRSLEARRISEMSRRSSNSSSNSAISELSNKERYDQDTIDEIEKRPCCRMPFIFNILRLNAPEWVYLLFGGLASLAFGVTMPVYRNHE